MPPLKNLISAVASLGLLTLTTQAEKPNIVFIFADDLGWGDVQCYNPENGKIPSPCMDQLAAEGMIFTDAHTSSSVCTPSRYSVITGRYNWRTHLQQGVIWGYSPALITPDRETVASFLQKNGYNTACIGKWHIGMDLPSKNGKPTEGRKPAEINVDWQGEIQNGPTDIGFDYYWGISASLDMAPLAYIEQKKFIEADYLTNTKQRTPKGPNFDAMRTLQDITDQSVKYIAEKAQGKKPFFMYIPLTSPHTPILPTEEWEGKSGLNKYADFVMQTDHEVGRIVAALDKAGVKENTIVIMSSDNGCSNLARIPDLKEMGHYPNGNFRGAKKSLYEGGHRVPFIVRWPAQVEAGSLSDQTVCLTDFFATCADAISAPLPPTAAEDSVSFLPALKGETINTERQGVIHHSYAGEFAYRKGKWKLLLLAKESNARMKDQLYDLEADPFETKDLYDENPEVVANLIACLKADIANGRSTKGPQLKNDVENISLWKENPPSKKKK